MTSEPAGLYVHVPFCVSKCPYCAFHSLPSLDGKDAFLTRLEREIALRAQPALSCDSVHLGGGTPSLLEPRDVARVLDALARAFDLHPSAERALEANPGTLSHARLKGLCDAGVNRIAIGAQSFDAEDLAFLGRIHGPADVDRAFRDARRAGFSNVGLDLMVGLPGRDAAHAQAQLVRAVALEPEHLSCYALTVEPGTPLARRVEAGAVALPGEERDRETFLRTHRFLEAAGYPAYEVSNFSRGGRTPSRHNAKYWTHAPYLGFGPSAHSFSGRRRRWNPPTLAAWLSCDETVLAGGAGHEELGDGQRALEALALGLRTARGADLDRIEALAPGFRAANEARIADLCARGRGRLEGGRLVLTLEGLVLADSLAADFALEP